MQNYKLERELKNQASLFCFCAKFHLNIISIFCLTISYFQIISSGSTCTSILEHSFFCTCDLAIHIAETASSGPDVMFFSYSSLLILSCICAYTDKHMEVDSIENECIRQDSNYPSAKINVHSQLQEYQTCPIFVCSEKSISCHIQSGGLKI